MKIIHTKDGRTLYKDDAGHWLKKDQAEKLMQKSSDVREPDKEKQIAKAQETAKKLNDEMNVPYDQWGERLYHQPIEEMRDGQKWYLGSINDETNYLSEKDHTPVNRTEALREVDGWKNDDGTYGQGDEAIYIAYEDGKVKALHELEPGEKWSRKNICGVSVSTGDYELVWGGEWVRRNGKFEFEPYTTHEWDENDEEAPGYENMYSGYKTVGKQLRRVERKSVPVKKKDYRTGEEYDAYQDQYNVLRKSEVKHYTEKEIEGSKYRGFKIPKRRRR